MNSTGHLFDLVREIQALGWLHTVGILYHNDENLSELDEEMTRVQVTLSRSGGFKGDNRATHYTLYAPNLEDAVFSIWAACTGLVSRRDVGLMGHGMVDTPTNEFHVRNGPSRKAWLDNMRMIRTASISSAAWMGW